MATRPSPVNLIMSVVGFLVFMTLVLVVVGGGVGTVELLIWVALLVLGLALIVGRYVAASRPRT
jgi:hypothetical protein